MVLGEFALEMAPVLSEQVPGVLSHSGTAGRGLKGGVRRNGGLSPPTPRTGASHSRHIQPALGWLGMSLLSPIPLCKVQPSPMPNCPSFDLP